jgi:hypothetical protein
MALQSLFSSVKLKSMKIIATPRRVGLGAILLLLSTMVAVVPSFALPYGTSAVSEGRKNKEKKRKAVPEGDVLSMLGLSLGVLSCAAVARRRVA